MTWNWNSYHRRIIFVLHFAAQVSTRLFRIIFLGFFDYPLMGGSAGKAVVHGICINTCFRQYGANSVYDLVLSTG